MKPLNLALRYMDILFSGKSIDELNKLFTEDLVFTGPLFEFNSAEDYIQSLKSAPPVGFKYEIIRSYEDEFSACLVYQFSKPGVSVPMAQIFEVREARICKILLLFDTAPFS